MTLIIAGNIREAGEELSRCKDLVGKLNKVIDKHEDLKYSGLIYNAISEYVEASILYSLVTNNHIPSCKELNVHHIPYVQGLADVIGELKRLALNSLMYEDIIKAFYYLELMDTIYNNLRVLNYPEPLLPGVRHKVDVGKKVIEDLRSLLIDMKNRLELKKEISKLIKKP